ncbi:MAG: S-methyl-5-thioribose-1-phosphate isomerase [Candidatus Omnitrophica bacterium]|nr:S-methyl-5-thioribose-1-phosphate isomerase [Candidatus Omnitrophota bacterium]MDD5553050.1 S-methyl-5-thioribose-1-phosphate isomerase [Candidatus Omnitrophota bacterium]
MILSPLFWPVELKGKLIYILDETALPGRLSRIKAGNYRQACRAIKEMKTRAVGQVLLVMYTFLLESRRKTDLRKVAEAINATRPTLFFKMLTDMVLAWSANNASIERNITGFLEMLKNKRVEQAGQAAKLLKDEDIILTHCNVSGLLPLIAEFCRREGKNISFYVTETRPYLQGARLTAWELNRQGFDVTVICDSAAAAVLSKGKINKIIVGADHLAKNGDIANKVGTYQLAILGKYFNIPFYVLCPPASTVASGKDIKIEIRPEKELLEIEGKRIAPKGVKGYYPAFDITPNEYITRHIYLNIHR